MNAVLYLATVLIWGTTWIAIKWQLGVVPVSLSIAYRFFLAALLLFAILAVRAPIVRPKGLALRLVLAQGVCLFCVNFLCFYHATRWIPSGLVAVIFSTATLWNALNARWFFKQRIAPRVMLGGALGLCGVAVLFWQQIVLQSFSAASFLGLGLALLGTVSFSLGNLLSSRLQRLGLSPLETNAWAMLTGACISLLGSVLAGTPLVWDGSPRYVGALLYLVLLGSVVGFTAYLTLVGRMGAERAAYCTVLFPLVALNVSSWFEDYHWTSAALLGVVLVVAGNVLVFKKPALAARLAPASSRLG